MAPLRGNMFYISCYRKKHEKILSETVRPRALIFAMYYLLVDLYQVCSNYAPGAKNGPALRAHVLHNKAYIEKHMKKSSRLKP